VDLEQLAADLHRRFDETTAAREQALPAARRSIRASANSIRAIHRLEFDRAAALIEESRAALRDGLEAVRDHPAVRFAGYLQDAQKEYAEANITLAVVQGGPLPTPESLDIEDAPFLNGMAEAIGEARRRVLDLLRTREVDEGERLLGEMEDMYGLLVTIDYPDAITLNLRRSTDVARSLIEKTRGDLSIAFVQRDLHDALERHAREVGGHGGS
jgi:translin